MRIYSNQQHGYLNKIYVQFYPLRDKEETQICIVQKVTDTVVMYVFFF